MVCVVARRMPFHGYFRMRSDPIRLDSPLLLAYSMPPVFALTQTTTFPSEKVFAAPLFVACWLLTTTCAVRSTPPVRFRECVASGETRPSYPSCPIAHQRARYVSAVTTPIQSHSSEVLRLHLRTHHSRTHLRIRHPASHPFTERPSLLVRVIESASFWVTHNSQPGCAAILPILLQCPVPQHVINNLKPVSHRTKATRHACPCVHLSFSITGSFVSMGIATLVAPSAQ